ncbi:hypothetical protein [Saccharicrinis carchari]|uniref:hypothetical protein n=1 Tax=Saccharicrinis carchari TaxID=1168039 RepID=UPI0011579B0F|nr:hypothetical protein [Saccharicrinis carchari]
MKRAPEWSDQAPDERSGQVMRVASHITCSAVAETRPAQAGGKTLSASSPDASGPHKSIIIMR